MTSSLDIEMLDSVARETCEKLRDESHYLHKELTTRFSTESFLQLFAWNVLVAFWVNMLAAYVYEMMSGKETEKLREEVERLRSENERLQRLADEVMCKGILKAVPLVIQPSLSLLDIMTCSKARDKGIEGATRLFLDYGWPEDLAGERAKLMVDIIKRHLVEK